MSSIWVSLNNRIVLGSPKSLEYIESPYWISTSTDLSGMSPIWHSIHDRYTQKSFLNLSSLLWTSQTLGLSLSLFARCCLCSVGQLNFSILCNLLLSISASFILLSICSWLKSNFHPDCSFLLLGSLGLLPLSTWIPLLCIIIIYNASQRGGHLYPHELSVSFL